MSQLKYSNKFFESAAKCKYLGTTLKIKIAFINKLRVGRTQEILATFLSIKCLPLAISKYEYFEQHFTCCFMLA
jgi:hypothetical protein